MAIKYDACLIGLGEFGVFLGRELVQLGFNVLGLDNDAGRVAVAKDFLTLVYQLDATDKKALHQVGVQDMDVVVVSVGHSLEASVLISVNLQELGVKNVTVKAGAWTQVKVLKRLGVKEVIFPSSDSATHLAHRLARPDFIEFLPFGKGISLRELEVGKNWAGKTLRELAMPRNYCLQVVGFLEPDQDSYTIIPTVDKPLREGTKLMVIGKNEHFTDIET